jgi:general secretion pathway protein D
LPLTAPPSASYGKIGPQIKVTPHLNDSDDVRLDVDEKISDLTSDGPQGTLGTINFTEREATTTLTVKDGHTVIIGGLVRDKVEHTAVKVPLLGDIPVLGFLFRSSKDIVEKGNLVLILTPYIIRDDTDMRRIFEERMRERQEFLDHYFVFRDDRGDPPGFQPSRGRGLLSDMREASIAMAEKRRRDAAPPDALAAAHDPRPALDLPDARSRAPTPTAAAINVAPAPRNIERIEH